MKSKFEILITLLFIISSCEKTEFKHDLRGKWKIFASGGGIHGQGSGYDFDFMYFDHGNDYRFSRNDTIIEQGSYELIKNDNEYFDGEYALKYSVKNRLGPGVANITNEQKIILQLTHDTLAISDGMTDGFSFYSTKQ